MLSEKKTVAGKVLRILTLVLAVVIAVSSLASCSIAWRYSKYDRTGERYDYDLTEYISIPEYMGIEIPDIVYTASEQEIEDNKYKKLAYFAEETVVEDGVVEKYDLVVADYICKIDGVEYTNLCSTVNESYRNFMVGINYFMVPEIDEAILGMAPGETKEIEFVFPEPYYKDPLVSGLTAQFTVTVEKIRRQNFPEFDDEFVSTYYGAESADAYTGEIKTQLEHDIGNALENYEVNLTWNYIVSNSKLKKIPGKEFSEMNDYETDYYINLARKENMSLSEYATEKLGLESVNELYDRISEYSQEAVRDEMILYTIARCENITVSDSEYESALVELGQQYETSDLETCKQIAVSEYGSEVRFRSIVLLNKVYEYIADNATKIDADEYYANKAAGKYVVDPDSISGPSKTEILIIVISAVALILAALIIVLAIFAVKAKRRHIQAKTAKAQLEEKRRLRREQNAAKKKHYGDKKQKDVREDVEKTVDNVDKAVDETSSAAAEETKETSDETDKASDETGETSDETEDVSDE